MKNVGLKVVAILLAIVVWVAVSAPRRGRIRERTMSASLSLVGVPEHLVITTEVPGTVAVRLRGPLAVLRSLASQSLEASAVLSGITQGGEVEVTLRPDSINAPEELEVVSIVPAKVRFRVEALRQRSVAIRPLLIGDPPDGYVTAEIVAQPDRAIVVGPASQILKLSEVTTERIIMTGRTETFVQNVAVVTDSPMVRVLEPATTQVTVPVLAEVGPLPLPADGTGGSESEPRRDEEEAGPGNPTETDTNTDTE